MSDPISPDLAATYGELQDELCQTVFRWQMFRQLYATNKERIELMEATSPAFFQELEYLLLDGTIIHICRMTDPPTQRGGKFENLVIDQLRLALDENKHGALAAMMDQASVKVQADCKDLREHRNKRVAHFDKPTMLGPPDAVLPGIRLKTFDSALDSIGHYLNLFREEFYGSPMYFKKVHSRTDADSLVHFLKCAYAFDEMARQDWTLHQRWIDGGPFARA